MIISGYAWGHIVASGPWQLGRDIRVIDTHPRPLVSAQKHLTVSVALYWLQRQWRAPESLLWRLCGRQFYPFRLK
jgi:hypothetical protein